VLCQFSPVMDPWVLRVRNGRLLLTSIIGFDRFGQFPHDCTSNTIRIGCGIMIETNLSVNQTICQIQEVHYCMPVAACDICQRSAECFTTVKRLAIDLHLEHPVLLHITVSVHYCADCHHYFRQQPPFLRRDAIYTDRVVDKARSSFDGKPTGTKPDCRQYRGIMSGTALNRREGCDLQHCAPTTCIAAT
jgi:hypothetical protein